MTAPTPLLQVHGISKRFPGVLALEKVDFDLLPGEVHCLIGENGAGKSTFVKIIAGALSADAGEIMVRGRKATIHGPRAAKELGLAFIFQELSVVGGLTVAENVVLGSEPGRAGWFGGAEAAARTRDLLAGLGFDSIDPRARVSTLSTAEKQGVMIAKALYGRADVIVMDEPTSPLEGQEAGNLFRVIAALKAQGKGVIYITHKMREVEEIGDRVTVFKDGSRIATLDRREASPRQLFRLMVGARPRRHLPGQASHPGA